VLKDFEIVGFRTFSRLAIPRLGRVNLFVGRNGVGKTTVLEALKLYASPWPARAACQILDARDELSGNRGSTVYELRTLFHGRRPTHGAEARIGPQDGPDTPSLLRIVAEVGILSSAGTTTTTTPAPWEPYVPRDASVPEGLFSVKFVIGDRSFKLSGSGKTVYEGPPEAVGLSWDAEPGPVFLHGATPSVNIRDAAGRWDKLGLTEGGQRVLRIVQRTVAPISAIQFVEGPRKGFERMAMVSVEGQRAPVPLSVLGDGTVRIFCLALAMEYAGLAGRPATSPGLPANVFPMLLVDEFEMGVHYSLHADLWRFVLQAARDLGVQVFATTHSWDCILGFQEAAAADEQADAVLIRLEAGREKFRAVAFGKDEMAVVTRDRIEVR
jgi:hypothetical protein